MSSPRSPRDEKFMRSNHNKRQNMLKMERLRFSTDTKSLPLRILRNNQSRSMISVRENNVDSILKAKYKHISIMQTPTVKPTFKFDEMFYNNNDNKKKDQYLKNIYGKDYSSYLEK